MTVFEQSYTWDELIRHFVDSDVVEIDKKAVSSFYDRGYIAERLKGLETELALECHITLNGEAQLKVHQGISHLMMRYGNVFFQKPIHF